ncbi:glutamine--tRNA ligase/YqeY domain fusion protein [SAR202 cluster bacterium AD-804-J14_MRT_500m]|nr:glutamine--tRNA ligase/YqeY domain fusion protein [SAR202 cluster bacterium AD-804-J14_MRT_500m]
MSNSINNEGSDFIREIVADDLRANIWGGQIITRFPPEPNGHLHIGHAKSLCLNFGIADETGGICHLRFDDTNPLREEQAYVESIKEDVRWLGWDWGDHLYFASDYFDTLYRFGIDLIEKGKAYIDDLAQEQIRLDRGTLKQPGKESPFRNRPINENLDLFRRMKSGEFEEGSRVLRAKIDMSSGNLNMRDPVLFRIIKSSHHRTGDTWCIYPMYDLAHGQSDSIEKVTHSICTMEFEDHRPLYDWFLDNLGIHHPKQIEFARLNLSHTVLSKRKLLQLVDEGHVDGWNDPRMPTLSGLRRRGYTPESIKTFCNKIGVAKRQTTIEVALLEHCLREDLNQRTPRALAVLRPLKVIIDNYPKGQTETLEALNNPEDPSMGSHKINFSGMLYIESDDFLENPSSKFYRLSLGSEVRLRYGYFITCVGFEKDKDTGAVTALHCTYDPATKGGQSPDGRKVKGTIHWVSATHALQAKVRLYDHLYTLEKPDELDDHISALNPNSLEELTNCKIEARLGEAVPGSHFQFERLGYFCVDTVDSKPGSPVFNRTVPLRDSRTKVNPNHNR